MLPSRSLAAGTLPFRITFSEVVAVLSYGDRQVVGAGDGDGDGLYRTHAAVVVVACR